MRFLEK